MSSIGRHAALAILALGLAGPGSGAEAANQQTTLHRFTNDLNNNADGAFPKAGVVMDTNKSLYGTTYEGGANGRGTVFKLVRTPNGPTAWQYSTLFSFCQSADCIDGSYPEAEVTLDAQGNIYGTTYEGGGSVKQGPLNFGTVFMLKKSGNGYTERVLYAFTGLADGAYPRSNLLLINGELYGTTYEGGDDSINGCLDIGCGTVVKLSPTSFGPWKLTVLHTFSGNNGSAYPLSGLTADAAGNLYGTTSFGGGTVYKLTKPAIANNPWKHTVLHRFLPNDDGGSSPQGGVGLDNKGNLYGTTYEGGTADACGVTGCGTVYKLTKPANANGTWGFTVLHSFSGGNDGAFPLGTLLVGPNGSLYGTASEGGAFDYGTVFKMTPTGGSYGFTLLRTFRSIANGSYPYAGVIKGPQGSIYGTTYEGGYTGGSGACGFNDTGCGVVFQLPPN